MPIDTWRESTKRVEPGSFQWPPVPGQEAVNTNQSPGAPSEHCCAVPCWLTGTGCLETVGSPLWRCSEAMGLGPLLWVSLLELGGGAKGHRRPCQPQLFWDSVILRKKDSKICQQIVHGHNTDVKGRVPGQSFEEQHFNLTKWPDHGAKQKRKSKAAGNAETVWESLITKVGTSLPSSSATNSPHPTSDNMQFLCMNSVCVLQMHIYTILHFSRDSGNLRCMFQETHKFH